MASRNSYAQQDAPYKVVRLKSWDEYLSIISDSPYQHWAFRGQRDASAPLFSALSRYFMSFRVDPRAWPEQEERILRIFKRKAIHFLDNVPDRNDDFEWLALMQDHGAPTRLLDFTWSPYVAAFFALHNTTKEGVIWACNPVEIERMMNVDLEKPGSFRKHLLSGAGSFVWLGEPYAMNRRLIAQSGTFLVSSHLGMTVEQILGRFPDADRLLVKFVLPAPEVRREAMASLYSMNITQATLFPGLDGLARSMAYEFEYSWSVDLWTNEQLEAIKDPHSGMPPLEAERKLGS